MERYDIQEWLKNIETNSHYKTAETLIYLNGYSEINFNNRTIPQGSKPLKCRILNPAIHTLLASGCDARIQHSKSKVIRLEPKFFIEPFSQGYITGLVEYQKDWELKPSEWHKAPKPHIDDLLLHYWGKDRLRGWVEAKTVIPFLIDYNSIKEYARKNALAVCVQKLFEKRPRLAEIADNRWNYFQLSIIAHANGLILADPRNKNQSEVSDFLREYITLSPSSPNKFYNEYYNVMRTTIDRQSFKVIGVKKEITQILKLANLPTFAKRKIELEFEAFLD